MVTAAGRKVAARHLIEQHRVSDRSACQLVGISRSAFRYQARARNDHALRAQLRELAAQQSAYGYLFLHSMLKTEGLVINRKRTYRIYTEENCRSAPGDVRSCSVFGNHLKSLGPSTSLGLWILSLISWLMAAASEC